MKKVHKGWKLTLATLFFSLLLLLSYAYTAKLIIDLENYREEYNQRIAELQYQILNCRLNTINELVGAGVEIHKEPQSIEDMRVAP